MTAIFKADKNETDEKYCVSEWWVEPNSGGSSPHLYKENIEDFYVLEGTRAILFGENWTSAEKGTFVRISANTIHDFKNETNQKAGLLNFYIPGGFEKNMPAIVQWFENNN
jgi:mannose-6-phosphate isomerase-like protein (cupin superfamily)